MKKTFKLTHPKIKYDRMVDAVRNDVNKYLKRERRKEIPDGYDYWDFDCRYGDTEDSASVIHIGDIKKHIADAQERQLESFYLEILAKPAKRPPRAENKDPAEQKDAGEEKKPESPWGNSSSD